jgi:hypothetical protein
MQFDIFEHSRDVMLRNAVIDALWSRNVDTAACAIGNLAAEFPGDSLLLVFNLLYDRLALPVTGPLDWMTADKIMRATEGVTAAAQRVFASEADSWLSPFWTELAVAGTNLPFDPRNEQLHAAPFFLRAGKWSDAIPCIESIPSWRRQPVPLSWKIEATARIAGVDPLWPFLAELSWMAPRRAQELTTRLNRAELNKLVRRFHVEFEGEGTANDFAWFPAWVLIVHPQLASSFHMAQAGADTAPERCVRLMLSLLTLERQGRHAMLIDGRKRLRDAHPSLFERYMQSRPASLDR